MTNENKKRFYENLAIQLEEEKQEIENRIEEIMGLINELVGED